MRRMPGATSSTRPGSRSNVLLYGMSSGIAPPSHLIAVTARSRADRQALVWPGPRKSARIEAIQGRGRMSRVFGLALALCGLLLGDFGSAAAQTYPSGPIRWLAGFAAGGTADIISRAIGSVLDKVLRH